MNEIGRITKRSAEKALTALSQYIEGVQDIKIFSPYSYDYDGDTMQIGYRNDREGFSSIDIGLKDEKPYLYIFQDIKTDGPDKNENAEEIVKILDTLKREITDASPLKVDIISVYYSYADKKHMVYTGYVKPYDFPSDIEKAEKDMEKELNTYITNDGTAVKTHYHSYPGEITMDNKGDVTLLTIDIFTELQDRDADLKEITTEEYMKDPEKYEEDYYLRYDNMEIMHYDLKDSLYKKILEDNIGGYDTATINYGICNDGIIRRDDYLTFTTDAELDF